jgi:SAM-dependent methyltransferase
VRRNAAGFAAAAPIYDEGRPPYPVDAIAALLCALEIRRGDTVVSLGAGTGRLERALLPTGCSIVAVEPVDAMFRRLRRLRPAVRVAAGVAEAVPLSSACADAVVVGQAWHWFDGPRAQMEARRLLRPGGGLGLVWTSWDESEPYLAELTAIRAKYAPGLLPDHRSGAWRAAFASGWTPLQSAYVRFEVSWTSRQLVRSVLSASFLAGLPPSRRIDISREVRAVLDRYFTIRTRGRVSVPHVCDAWWTWPLPAVRRR